MCIDEIIYIITSSPYKVTTNYHIPYPCISTCSAPVRKQIDINTNTWLLAIIEIELHEVSGGVSWWENYWNRRL